MLLLSALQHLAPFLSTTDTKTNTKREEQRNVYQVNLCFLDYFVELKILTAQCPELSYDFSDKVDFQRYSATGEIIQCPVCKTELLLNRDQELEVLNIDHMDYAK